MSGTTTTVTTQPSITVGTQTISLENVVLFLSLILGGTVQLVAGVPNAFLYGAILGAFSKAVLSFGTGLTIEDAILAVAAFASALALAIGNEPMYAAVALVIGAVGKALPSLATNYTNIGDWLLLIIPVFGALATYFTGITGYVDIGLAFGIIAKALASVSANPPTTTTTPATPPPIVGATGTSKGAPITTN